MKNLNKLYLNDNYKYDKFKMFDSYCLTVYLAITYRINFKWTYVPSNSTNSNFKTILHLAYS